MSDLIERLVRWSKFGYGVEASATMTEAAATIAQLQAELAEAREVAAKLRSDLNRCFKGETHSVRNERVLAKIETYTATAIEARDWSKP